jgi:alpha-tubulin suppressor-like RCC1 family protein
MSKNKGISLIVLIITIMVVIILSGTVVFSLSKNNPIVKAKYASQLMLFSSIVNQIEYYKTIQLINNIDIYNLNLYPIDQTIITTDTLSEQLRLVIQNKQKKPRVSDIEVAGRLFYIKKDLLGINGVEDKQYILDIYGGQIYIKNGMIINGNMEYALSNLTSEFIIKGGLEKNNIVAFGNNTYALDGEGTVWGVGTQNMYNQIGLLREQIYNVIGLPILYSATPWDNNIEEFSGSGITIKFYKSTGEVYVKGLNSYGQLGLGHTNNVSSYTKLNFGGKKVIQAIANGSTAFYLLEDNTLWAAGLNDREWIYSSQLIDEYRIIPTIVESNINTVTKLSYVVDGLDIFSNVKTIYAEYYNTSDLTIKIETIDGQLFGWGYDNYNAFNTGVKRNDNPVRLTTWETVKNAHGGIKKVEGSYCTTFILMNDGTAWTSGYAGYNGRVVNSSSQIGQVIFEDYPTAKVVGISEGPESSVMYAILDNGKTYGWGGDNTQRHIGTVDASIGIKKPSLVEIDNIILIRRRIAIVKELQADGSFKYIAYYLGTNANKDFNKRMDTTVDGSLIPDIVDITKSGLMLDPSQKSWTIKTSDPDTRRKMLTRSSITGASLYTKCYALLNSGKLYGWGKTNYSTVVKLDNIEQQIVIDPIEVQVPNGMGKVIQLIRSSDEDTVYIVDENSNLWVRGCSLYGRSGMGSNYSNMDSNRTMYMTFTKNIDLSNRGILVKFISPKNSSSIIVSTDNKVYSSGHGACAINGIGNYSWLYSYTEIKKAIVNGELVDMQWGEIKSVTQNGYDAIMLMEDGTMYSWGDNSYGQLGLGYSSTEAAIYPTKIDETKFRTQVDIPEKVIDIVRAEGCNIFLTDMGNVYLYGYNGYGQAGNGSTLAAITLPIKANISDVRSIYAGSYHVIAVKKDNSIWAWGNGDQGQLGNFTYSTSYNPVRATELERVFE